MVERAAERHQHVAIAGDHGDAAARLRERQAEADHRRAAEAAPNIEVPRIITTGSDIIGRRADTGDHQQVAAIVEKA
jgi:hypothetical protein